MKKHLVLSLLVLGFMGSAFGQVTVTPGQDNLLNGSVNRSVVSTDGFNAFTNTSGLYVSVPVDAQVGEQELNVSFTGDNDSNTSDFQSYVLDVSQFTDWSFNRDEIVRNASVLSGGSLNLSITAEGNTAESVSMVSYGDLSNLSFQVQSPVTAVPNESIVVANGYSVPRGKSFGWYNGTVNGSGGGFSDSVNVSIRVFDDIAPSVEGSSFGDVMALQGRVFSVDAVDNLKVVNVSGVVSFEERERIGNTTQLVTKELTRMDFVKSSDSSTWTYTLKDTDREGNYSYNVTVRDESGNIKELNGSFEINRLDSINVLTNDFEFKDVRPRTDDAPERLVDEQVFTKEFEKELKVGLTGFSHRKNNSSMTVGLKGEGSDNLDFLYRDGELQGNVTVSGSGTYSLVVFSDSQGDTYSGDLKLYPVPQHEVLENGGVIRFSGTVVDPEYPELPESRSIGDFEGGMEFILNENDVPVGIRFTGENRDIEDCKGVDSWSNCIPGYTLGELPEAQSQVEEWKKQASDAVFWRNFFMMIGIGFPFFSVYNRWSRGTFMQEPRIPKQFVGQEVRRLNDVKLSRRDATKNRGVLG